MQTSRKVLIFLATVALAGCNYEKNKCDEAASIREGERAAEISYAETQASIAAACDAVIELCPKSVAAPGRAAQAAGFGGGGGIVFWAAMVAKLAALGATLGAGLTVLQMSWIRSGRPAADAVAAAQALVKSAADDAAVATSRATAARADADKAASDLAKYQAALTKIRADLEAESKRVDALKAEAAGLEMTRKALQAFD